MIVKLKEIEHHTLTQVVSELENSEINFFIFAISAYQI